MNCNHIWIDSPSGQVYCGDCGIDRPKKGYDEGYKDGFHDGVEVTKTRYGTGADKPAQALGKLGGEKTASLYGKEHFSKISKGWPKDKKRKVDTQLEKK